MSRQIRLYFIPLHNFEANGPAGQRSAYVKDMYYTVRSPQLETFAREWERQGKVRFTTDRPRVVATGTMENH